IWGKPGSLKTRSPPAITSRWTIPAAWKVVWKDFLPFLLQSQQAPSRQSIPSGAPSQPVSLRSHVPTSESPSEQTSEINSEHLGTPPEAGQAGLRLLQSTQDSMLGDTPLHWMRRGEAPKTASLPTDEVTCLTEILEVYCDRLFPIWPIVDAADLRNKLQESPGKAVAARLLANAVALAAIAQLKLDVAWQPSVEEAETSGLNETLGLLDGLRISFFLHIYHENASPGGTKSLVYLREAITQAQILRLDRESTYASLSEADQHVSRRVLWLLFVTERGVALLHKLPIVLKPNILLPWFGGADDQAEVLPAFLKLVHLFWVFDQSGIFEILRNADADSDIPSMASVAQSCLELLQQKLHDSMDNDDWGPINEVQRADMFVTRQWMRAVLWRAALRFGIVIPAMNPINIAKDFLSLVSELPKTALESHGPTLEFKTFEIATAVIDAMASNHSTIPTDPPGPILRQLRDILSSCRGGNRTLLALLTMKLDAASGSGLLIEPSDDEAVVFQTSTDSTFQTADLLTAQPNMVMPTYQFMEEQASQICWPPLDLGYLVRSPSPLTRMLLESMPRDVENEDDAVTRRVSFPTENAQMT
ncbi:hypothetical protein FALBO_14389, partial [Fusarium albosuccineum]